MKSQPDSQSARNTKKAIILKSSNQILGIYVNERLLKIIDLSSHR